MACSLMAVDPSVLHNLIAGTGKLVIQIYHSLGQPCGHGNDLKSRAWLISIINGGIPPHLITGVLIFFLCHLRRIPAGIQGKWIIEIILRHVYIGIDFPVLRVHKKNGDALGLFFFHYLQRRLLGVHLNIFIQAGLKVIPFHPGQ